MTSLAIQGILVLADLLNFSRAAEKMNITQPAFSRVISRAEQELGFQIFLRNTRSVRLTREGEVFLASLRQAYAIYSSGISYSKAMLDAENHMNIGISANFVSAELTPLIIEFKQKHREIHVECIPLTMEEIPVRLRSNVIDIGLLFTERTRFRSDFSSRIIKKIPLGVVVSKEHRLASCESVHPAQLVNENIISLQSNAGIHEIASYGAPLLLLNKKFGLHLETSTVALSTQDQLLRVACNQGITLFTATLDYILPKNTVLLPLTEGIDMNLTALWIKKSETPIMTAFLNEICRLGTSEAVKTSLNVSNQRQHA